ncbi:hypothetical protein, partial [Acinetobacter variabilis]
YDLIQQLKLRAPLSLRQSVG